MGIEAQIHFLIPSLCSIASSQMIVSLRVAKREEVEWELMACFFRVPCRPDLRYQSRVLDRPLGIPAVTTGKKKKTKKKHPPDSAGDLKRHGFNPWVGKIPWKRRWQPTPVILPGESHRGAWWAAVHGLHRVGHDWSSLARMHWVSSSLTGQPSWPEVILWGKHRVRALFPEYTEDPLWPCTPPRGQGIRRTRSPLLLSRTAERARVAPWFLGQWGEIGGQGQSSEGMGKATATWRSGGKRDTQNQGAAESSCCTQEGLPGGEWRHRGNPLLLPSWGA